MALGRAIATGRFYFLAALRRPRTSKAMVGTFSRYEELLLPGAKLVWTVEAGSHFEAMTKYYEYMGWGEYKTEFESDYKPYED